MCLLRFVSYSVRSKSLRGSINLRAAYWMALLYSRRDDYIQALKFSMWYYEWEIDNIRKVQARNLMNHLIDEVHKHNGYEIFVAEDESGCIEYTYVFDTQVSPSMKDKKKLYAIYHPILYLLMYAIMSCVINSLLCVCVFQIESKH